MIQGTIDAVNKLDIGTSEKDRIFEKNARTLLRLDA